MKRIFYVVGIAILLFTGPQLKASVAQPEMSVSVESSASETLSPISTGSILPLKKDIGTEVAHIKSRNRSFLKKVFKFFLPEGDKKQGIAALLALFFGGLGFHRFYLGHSKSGMVQVLLTFLGISLVIVSAGMNVVNFSGTITKVSGAFIAGLLILLGVSIWSSVDFIRILTGNLKPKKGKYIQ